VAVPVSRQRPGSAEWSNTPTNSPPRWEAHSSWDDPYAVDLDTYGGKGAGTASAQSDARHPSPQKNLSSDTHLTAVHDDSFDENEDPYGDSTPEAEHLVKSSPVSCFWRVGQSSSGGASGSVPI
jgi:hypothetical protein